MLSVQTKGYATKGHPETIHSDVANMSSLFIGPTIAKRANNFIQQLQQLDAEGKMEPVQPLRLTADGRSVIDRGPHPDKQDVLLKGAFQLAKQIYSSGGEGF